MNEHESDDVVIDREGRTSNLDTAEILANMKRREREWEAMHGSGQKGQLPPADDEHWGSDPIVAEVRRAREEIAAICDYDIHKIGEYVRYCTQDLPGKRVSFDEKTACAK